MQYYLNQKNEKWEPLDPLILSTVCDNLDNVSGLCWRPCQQNVLQVSVNFYSEYKRNEQLFRCHPNYRSEGPWHDWVMVRWLEQRPTKAQPDLRSNPSVTHGDDVVANRYCYTPCKIIGMFFHVPGSGLGKEDEYFAVVWPCNYKFKKSSVFTTRWELNFHDNRKKHPAFELINCSSIVRHCCMIPESVTMEEKSTVYHELWPRELWADEF
jgi:hypothetical protein